MTRPEELPIFPIGHKTPGELVNPSANSVHDPDRESVGSFVRARRRAAGLTQRQLADLVGTGTRLISELENGKPTLRMDAVNRVLAAFGKQLGCVDLVRRDDGGSP